MTLPLCSPVMAKRGHGLGRDDPRNSPAVPSAAIERVRARGWCAKAAR
jgi:hypothetical protein